MLLDPEICVYRECTWVNRLRRKQGRSLDFISALWPSGSYAAAAGPRWAGPSLPRFPSGIYRKVTCAAEERPPNHVYQSGWCKWEETSEKRGQTLKQRFYNWRACVTLDKYNKQVSLSQMLLIQHNTEGTGTHAEWSTPVLRVAMATEVDRGRMFPVHQRQPEVKKKRRRRKKRVPVPLTELYFFPLTK